MRRVRALCVALCTLAVVAVQITPALSGHARVVQPDEGGEGPYPGDLYLMMRAAQVARYRGIPWTTPYDARARAYVRMRTQQRLVARDPDTNAAPPSWSEVGPAPIPNGYPPNAPVSGRVTSIVVDPANANIVYLGAAQGGVWRTTDGGSTWTPLMDTARSLAIGALALDPNDHTTLWVGTGEGNFSGDSFFGVGLYRIVHADGTSGTTAVQGPFGTRVAGLGTSAGNGRAFYGTSISRIVIDPADSSRMWIGTTWGWSGQNGGFAVNAATPGLYFTDTATGATPTFAKDGHIGTKQVTDVALQPGSSSTMLVGAINVNTYAGDGIYRTTNASAAPGTDPAFSRVEDLRGTPAGVVHFSFSASAPNTVFAVYNKANGTLIKSTNGGATWGSAIPSATGFCDHQCGYDLVVSVKPTDPKVVLLGGNYHYDTGNGYAIMRATNGSTFAGSEVGLHPDTHAVVWSDDGTVVWTGNDGGVWKSFDDGATWMNENGAGPGITQFQSIATHPVDPNLSIGGTQDNGTELFTSGASWTQSDGGDGGFALIDQSSTSTTSDTMYHTFYSATGSTIGFSRSDDGGATWSYFFGCSGIPNGISCTDDVLFYAPMALGPGTPNTLYFGTAKLYRSANQSTMSQVSQVFENPISAIGIAPSDDDVRIVGLTDGRVFATSSGSNPLTDVTGPWPAAYIGRTIVDPADPAVAYVTLDAYFGDATAHVWRTGNLGPGATWTPAGTGIPDVPVNAFVIDPNDPTHLFAGTDVGVYESTDSGSSWAPYGTGLPDVAVFDLAVAQPGTAGEVLRAATHGRGVWQAPVVAGGGAPTHTLTVTATGGQGTGTVSSADGFIFCGSVCAHAYTDGSTVMLTATPTAGSTFDHWTNCSNADGPRCTEVIGADRTVGAAFLPGPGFQPDLWIREGRGAYRGKDVHNSNGQGQTLTVKEAPGDTATFTLTLQNDAGAIDSIDVRGPGNGGGLKLAYSSGAGCCATPLHLLAHNVDPGAKGGVVKITVRVARGASPGRRTLTFKATSRGDGSVDVVRIVVRIT